ncbi:MAG TPA: SCP2 sterol-binding domain-containing protein [Steroidobacteraceae bacterium]|jgi:ubiquinone biosynthesis protein UbiJ|nr:SCP2 sterol-binding domain-containing protein [Steroidobacteraceae bacterium]
MSNWVEIGIRRLLDRATLRASAESPRAAGLLRSLVGRRLVVRVQGTPWQFAVESTGETLRLFELSDASATATATAKAVDATLSGAPISLLALAGPDPQAVINRGDVTINGDAEIAQQFRELGMLLRPDLEVGLSKLIGRSPAHVAMRAVRATIDGSRERARTLTQSLADYLAHERRDLVSRAEAEHFLRGVDEMRERLDRLDARIADVDRRMRKS